MHFVCYCSFYYAVPYNRIERVLKPQICANVSAILPQKLMHNYPLSTKISDLADRLRVYHAPWRLATEGVQQGKPDPKPTNNLTNKNKKDVPRKQIHLLLIIAKVLKALRRSFLIFEC